MNKEVEYKIGDLFQKPNLEIDFRNNGIVWGLLIDIIYELGEEKPKYVICWYYKNKIPINYKIISNSYYTKNELHKYTTSVSVGWKHYPANI